jgi:hypothetical protein
MIIFDLDGTLADCEHRRHLVDPSKNPEYSLRCNPKPKGNFQEDEGWYHITSNKKFKPDWDAFHEACNKDEPIRATCEMFLSLAYEPYNREIEIWSARSESTRAVTISWLEQHIPEFEKSSYINRILKMRPLGEYTPDEQLKERWLDEVLAQGKTIDFVFDDRVKVVRMWRRRGIFVFDVNQTGKEF